MSPTFSTVVNQILTDKSYEFTRNILKRLEDLLVAKINKPESEDTQRIERILVKLDLRLLYEEVRLDYEEVRLEEYGSEDWYILQEEPVQLYNRKVFVGKSEVKRTFYGNTPFCEVTITEDDQDILEVYKVYRHVISMADDAFLDYEDYIGISDQIKNIEQLREVMPTCYEIVKDCFVSEPEILSQEELDHCKEVDVKLAKILNVLSTKN
jgi:hypothetical protein